MNRSTRTIVVVAIAMALAGGATYLVYRTIASRPTKVVEVATAYAVVASHQISVGSRLTTADVKLVPWPAANPVPGGFTTVEAVLDRGVISSIAENEPLSGNNIATKEAGSGLPPSIPPGMRAIAVKVNEVVGVAGFVFPGSRVDVMCILRDNGAAGSVARVVVSNVQVLAAGTKYDQEAAREGKALPSSVVTLMVSPEDAERVGLAASEGQIMLTLRNPMDAAPTVSNGTRTASLTGAPVAPPKPAMPTATAPSSGRRAAAPPPPPVLTPAVPPPPAPFSVQVIKGGTATQQIIKQEIIK